jgi:hypothetical protein
VGWFAAGERAAPDGSLDPRDRVALSTPLPVNEPPAVFSWQGLDVGQMMCCA